MLLLSISVTDLQLLVDRSLFIFGSLDLQVNSSKSSCLRIGKKFRSPCKPIFVNNTPLHWVNEFDYLGVPFKSGLTFSCNWHTARSSFFKQANSILSTLGHNPPLDVALSLVRSTCIPSLTYGTDALTLTASEIRSFSYALNSVFCKLFKTSSTSIIE